LALVVKQILRHSTGTLDIYRALLHLVNFS